PRQGEIPRARQARERVLPGEGRDVEERRGAPGLPFVPGQALLEKRAGAKDQDLPAVARHRDGRRGGTCRTELPHLAPLATRVVRPEADDLGERGRGLGPGRTPHGGQEEVAPRGL